MVFITLPSLSFEINLWFGNLSIAIETKWYDFDSLTIAIWLLNSKRFIASEQNNNNNNKAQWNKQMCLMFMRKMSEEKKLARIL